MAAPREVVVPLRRGQRRTDPCPLGRALRPRAGPRRRLRQGIASTARWPTPCEADCSTSRSPTGSPGDPQRPHHRDERGRTGRATAGRVPRPGLPAGRRHESVRRRGHRTYLGRHVRPGLPHHDGLPGGGGRADIVLRRAPRVPAVGASGRRTRPAHPRPPRIRLGSSVRGAIDMTKLTAAWPRAARPSRRLARRFGRRLVALSGGSGSRRPPAQAPEQVVRGCTESIFGKEPKEAEPPSGGDASGGASAHGAGGPHPSPVRSDQ